MHKRLLALMLSVAVIMSTLIGTTAFASEKTLLDAIIKTSSAKSMESNGKISLKLNVSGVSDPTLQGLTDMINNLEVNFDTKAYSKDADTLTRAYLKLWTSSKDFPVNAEVWADMNLTGKKPVMKEIVKAPELLSMLLPSQSSNNVNKYMVIDALNGINELPVPVSPVNKDVQQKMISFMLKYAGSFDIGHSIVSDKGISEVNGKSLHSFEVNISDSEFKSIAKKAVNELSTNTEAVSLIKEIMGNQISDSEIKSMTQDFNKLMENIKDIQIIADKGIHLSFAIDENGYIVKQSGSIPLILDETKLTKVLDGTSNTSPTQNSVYNLELSFDVNNSNVNGNVVINLPILNSSNSFSYLQLFETPKPQPKPQAKPIPKKIIKLSKKKSFRLYKKCYYVNAKDAVSAAKGKYVYSKGNVTIKVNGKTIKFKKGKNYITVNGKVVKFKNVNGFIYKNKLYVPMSVFSAAGINVKIK